MEGRRELPRLHPGAHAARAKRKDARDGRAKHGVPLQGIIRFEFETALLMCCQESVRTPSKASAGSIVPSGLGVLFVVIPGTRWAASRAQYGRRSASQARQQSHLNFKFSDFTDIKGDTDPRPRGGLTVGEGRDGSQAEEAAVGGDQSEFEHAGSGDQEAVCGIVMLKWNFLSCRDNFVG
jgi:hypothetical protein